MTMDIDRKLGIFETAQALSSEYASFNVVVVLHLRNGPEVETLASVLARLQARHRMLNARVVRRGKDYWFTTPAPGDGGPIPLTTRIREGDEQWRGVAEDELNRRLDASSDPPLRCVYLRPKNGGDISQLVLTFYHGIMDGASGAAFIDELLQLCAFATDVDLPPLPEELLPPAEVLFPEKFQGLRRVVSCAGFMARQAADEVRYRFKTRAVPRPRVSAASKCRICTMELSKDLTTRLVRRARAHRISLDWALAAAMLRAVLRVHYKESARLLRHVTFANLRPYLRPPQAPLPFASLIAVLRLTVEVSDAEDLWTFARRMSAQLHAGLKRGDKFASFLMSLVMMRSLLGQRKQRMGATALSFGGVAAIAPEYGKIGVCELHTFVSNFDVGPEYTAQAWIFDGRLGMDVLFLDTDMDLAEAEAIAEKMRSLLCAAMETEE